MATDNVVTLVGNITDDPELRYTPSGQQVANFTVAVNRRMRNQDGSWDDKLDGFFRCSCWRDLAEHVAESLTKGTRVIVTGRLQQRSWETEDNQRRSVVEIQVDEVGPSLRWAKAKVEKAQRSSPGGAGGSGEWGGAPAGQPAGGQSGDVGGRPAAPQGGGDWGAPAPSGPPRQDNGGDW
jgi:single-strand DNA-binding protein